MNPLKQLHEVGQSIWLDNIRRALLDSGTLARYIADLSVTGLTSNPTIFDHAIGGSNDYDEAIRSRLDKKLTTEELFFEVAMEDITDAADLFRPVYDAAGGNDGFVSLEVSPTLADDADGTIAQAKKLHATANRPNVLIKVPGTTAGATAIEELIAAGIAINVTLLFSREHYVAAAEAYMRGLERRAKDNLPLDIPSVASLFISRWDVAASPKLPDNLKNALGMAIGKRTYKAYRDLLASERWRRLAEGGALPQRLLWASTGTKDPSLPDSYYVTGLAAPDTVNTMPEATLLAFGKHGEVAGTLPDDGGDAETTIAAIEKAGVDTDGLAAELQVKGRDSFVDSFDQLLASIETKVGALREASAHEKETIGPLGTVVDAATADLTEKNATERIWSLDYTLWGKEPTEIADRIGWLVSPHEMEEQADDLESFAKQARDDGFTHAMWSGMGGSSLFPQVLQEAFGEGANGLDLRVLDTSDPGTVDRFLRELPLDKTLFLFASKSGGTLETRSHLDTFWEKVGKPEQFIAITDPGTALDKLATERRFRRVFRANPNIGGRYSALTHFGMVPAALLGVDFRGLLRRAGYMVAAVGASVPAPANPALRFGALLGAMSKNGHDKCTLIMPDAISSFSTWLEQLIAESTGKHGVGILPVAGEDLGPPDVYGNDRLFVSLGEAPQAAKALAAAGFPLVELDYVDRLSIGSEVVRWEYAIAMAGIVLGINPFDQPNVEAAKAAAAKVLAEGMPDIPVEPVESILSKVKPGDYIAIQAYIDTESPEIAGLQKARMNLRDRFKVATTLGIGPRYLHSTGQLHKGGAPTGVFLQIVGDDPVDVAIPGKPFGFSQLKHAQAAGDYLALKDRGLRVARVAMDEVLALGR
jgi:transaldolase / glucose-6-phosphate isomerase